MSAGEPLPDDDPCFGRHHAPEAEECRRCTAPMIVDGRIRLVREECRDRSRDERSPDALPWTPSAEDVRRCVERGETGAEILTRMAGPDPGPALARTARKVLGRRLSHLRRGGYPAPSLAEIDG